MDYAALGFKAGLEIHQQLEGKKLFCDCPALNSEKKPNRKTERRLRAVIGETGEVDIAAAHEMKKNKLFEYVGNSEDTCLVEFDEEPPHEANPEHIQTAIIAAKLLHAEIVDEIQVMRKIVVDGSNVGGFQRTMLIARNGYIETEKGKVIIPAILLEEEAAQKGKETKDKVTYKLDRLGLGMLEISTDASLKDAQHVQEVASYIGMVLRSTGKVKRGLGTIRQDVNLSVKGGERVEIKGFQDLRSIPKVIEKEVNRHVALLKEGKIMKKEVRKAEADFSTSFLRPIPGAARLYPETDALPIPITKELLKVQLPTLLKDKIKTLTKKHQFAEEVAEQLIKSNIDFEMYATKYKNLKPSALVEVLLTVPKDLRSRLKVKTEKITQKHFQDVLTQLNEGNIPKDAVPEILTLLTEGKKVDYTKFKVADAKDVEEVVKKIVKENPNLSQGAYMGMIMQKMQGKVDGKKVASLLKKYL